MNPGKPYLFDIWRHTAPKILHEINPPLIERDRVADHVDSLIVLGELKVLGSPGPADGADRIPYSEKMNPHRPAEGSPEPLAERPIVMALEYVPGERDQLFIALREQAHLVEHRGKYSRRVGAAAKSKDVDRISFLIVPHQEPVSVGNVVREQPGDRKIEAGSCPALHGSPTARRRR